MNRLCNRTINCLLESFSNRCRRAIDDNVVIMLLDIYGMFFVSLKCENKI